MIDKPDFNIGDRVVCLKSTDRPYYLISEGESFIVDELWYSSKGVPQWLIRKHKDLRTEKDECFNADNFKLLSEFNEQRNTLIKGK